jgi:hypothetical protein
VFSNLSASEDSGIGDPSEKGIPRSGSELENTVNRQNPDAAKADAFDIDRALIDEDDDEEE